MAKHLRDLFEQSRKSFLDYIDAHVPHANKAVRVRKLARAADAFENSKNYLAMAAMLERIAKEVGNAYTNRREFTGKDGGALVVTTLAELRKRAFEERQRGAHPALESRTADNEGA